MATIAAAPPYTDVRPQAVDNSVWSWLTTVDHKRIGALYLVSALFFFIVGGLLLSQLITLFVTPAVYLLLDRLQERLRRRPAAS